MKTYIITYWREHFDEKVDFEKEIEAPNLDEALYIFRSEVSKVYKIESIIEKK